MEPPKKNVIILGHAGAGVDLVNSSYKPNTEKAIRAAVEVYQIDGVEVDVQFSKDGVPVLFHDPYLENTLTELSGRVHERMAGDMIGKPYRGYPHNSQEELLSLEWLFDYVNNSSKKVVVNLDIKVYDPDFDYKNNAKLLDSLIFKYNLMDQMIIESKSRKMLLEMKKVDPAYLCLFHTEYEASMIKPLFDDGLNGAVVRFNEVNQEIINEITKHDLLLTTYGQIIQSDFNHIGSKNSDIVQVDNPVLALRWKD
ncbi:MAG: hypothetical protein JXR19_02325 [Bacteroidia bacterium]